ncbi:hypothetical protein ACIOYV_15950 [Pseudomonas sp. NPDC087342]|uniref:hypothetical protein n=1 Tax=Pseudomonas sp. NPDC087342 TaxID=3364437 RepID=UPI0038247CE1
MIEISDEAIQTALDDEKPTESLRQLVIDWNNAGVTKDDILEKFQAFDKILIEQQRDQEVDLLEDVIDMMTGWYVGMNLELK